jgi:pimeloyl-ACP methyl ester carboxylesterase
VARRVIEAVNARWPSDHPGHTVEVDVVGFSMGGLVARFAAAPTRVTGFDRHLHVNQLYTLATPHRGARSAFLDLDRAVVQMKPGAVFLADLDECRNECAYEIVPYAQTNDWIVGARNAAPPGQEPIWTAGTLTFSHFTITTNRRVLVDIARRMRGEGGLAEPSEPPSH